MEAKADIPSVIIGNGRIGEMMATAGRGDDVVLGRGGVIPADVDGNRDFPIYVCVPNEEVESIIRSCPVDKLDDLVFMQVSHSIQLAKYHSACSLFFVPLPSLVLRRTCQLASFLSPPPPVQKANNT
eukprot:3775439-Rhodomonas_salina.1